MRARSETVSTSTQRGWRVPEFARDVGVGEWTIRRLLREGAIPSTNVAKCRVILISPEDFLARQQQSGG